MSTTTSVQDSPFFGSTSRPGARITHTPTTCLGCGSQLGGRRYQGVRRWGSKLVRLWICDCGRRRRVEVAPR